MDNLETGSRRALVREHMVLCGGSSKLKTVLTELGKDLGASAYRTVVVLAKQPKEEIEQLLGETKNGLENGARVIVRSGDPGTADGLLIASPNQASSIILLSPEDAEDNEAVMHRQNSIQSPLTTKKI
jgi:hypothetical protein